MNATNKLKKAIALLSVFSLFASAIALLFSAIRKRSLTEAFASMALTAAATAGGALLLTEALAPDTEGEKVVAPAEPDDTELFEGEALAEAEARLDNDETLF